MHNGAKSFMKSKAEFQIIYEVEVRTKYFIYFNHHTVISRDIFYKVKSFQSEYHDIINSTKISESCIALQKYDFIRKMDPL